MMLSTVVKVGEEKPDSTTGDSTSDKRRVESKTKMPGINSGKRENVHITPAEERMQRKSLGSFPKPSISIEGVKR